MPFSPIHEGPKSIDFDESEAPEDGIETNGQVEEVQRKETETVDVERGGVHVVVAEFGGVGLEHTVFQVPCPEVNPDVEQVQKVCHVVQAKP